MKNLTNTNDAVFTRRLLVASVIALLVALLGSAIPAKAAELDANYLEKYQEAFGTTPEEAAQQLLNVAADYGVIESQWLEEFEPGKEATYGDFARWAYNVSVLRTTGFANAKNHKTSKAMKWLKNRIVDAAFENPKDASNLIGDYTDGLGKKFKSTGKMTYHWAGVVSTVLLYGDAKYNDELWQEGLDNLALEAREKWAYFRSSERMTKIECLEYVVDMLCPWAYLGAPLAPPEEPEEIPEVPEQVPAP